MILIALGANLPSRFGEPHETLAAAKRVISQHGIAIIAESRTFLTAPVPVSDQPWYHNEVVVVETVLEPSELLEVLQGIENEFGRVRASRNASRVLDLDLLAYHDVVIDQPDLVLPHPRMEQRAFVLLPLRDVAPEWKHPLLRTSLTDLIAGLPEGQEARLMGETVLRG